MSSLMRRFALLLCALLLVGCSSSKPIRLTVLTYNIHHAEGVDRALDLDRIARVIKESNADLVALQEVDNGTTRSERKDQASELGGKLGMDARFGKSMNHLGGEYGNAVLARNESIKSQRIIDLPYTQFDKHEPRCALVTQIGLADGRDILFVSTHLDHNREPSDRYKQMRAIDAALVGEKLPIILAGDFNCVPDTEPLLVLDNSWLRATDDAPTVPVIKPKYKIDHIFVRPKKKWKVIETRVIQEHIASDHLPVVVTLEFAR